MVYIDLVYVYNSDSSSYLDTNPSYRSADKSSKPTQLFPHTAMFATVQCDIQKTDSNAYLHERPDIGDKSVTVVLDDGSRHFLKKRGEVNNGTAHVKSSFFPANGGLLTTPMRALAREAEALQVNMLTNRSNPAPVNHTYLARENVLWVDKYAPKAFSQLLSPEKINREVLRALKLWDAHVFGSRSSETGGAAVIDASSVLASEMMRPPRGDSRPFFKVLLFHGPPGTGKSMYCTFIYILIITYPE